SLQKGSVDIERDYKKIIRRIPEFMNPGSLLMLCLNSPDLSEGFLLDTVAEECSECKFKESISTPEVFSEAVSGKGLKVLVFEYLAQ
ncbi:MAG: class I SAM-dependent methyltransferase, partial [Gammaproteobacteria bacterium]|nr:class I SAM-dependent methyltransferase [Gammaproteobacteria bacterium]